METISEGIEMVRTDGRICSNVYLVSAWDGSGKILLIDAGDGRLPEVARLEPELVLLTHGHYDHTRGVRGGWQALLHRNDFSGDRFISAPAHAEPYPREMRIKWRGREFEMLHTPGHTPGCVSIFERKSGVLFSGDTLFADGVLGRTDLGFGSEADIVKSEKLLERLGFSLLCPGHGDIETRK